MYLVIGLFVALAIYFDYPKLKKSGQKKDVAVYVIILLLGISYGIDTHLGTNFLPNPMHLLEVYLLPLANTFQEYFSVYN